ncbi:MAG: hypothetical protein WCD35_19125 [Mycobacteriales bacterium]
MTPARRTLALSATVLVIAAALVAGGRTLLRRSGDLDQLKQSTAVGLLPPQSHRVSRKEADKHTGVDGPNPAYVLVTAQTTLSAADVRAYYRTQLTARGFTVQLSTGHPFGQEQDKYASGRIIALVNVPSAPAAPLIFSYSLEIARS